jgi:hypothetical protein
MKKCLHCESIETNFEGQMHWDHVYITNLSCNKLIMKIVWSSFIHRFTYFTQTSCVENMFITQINVLINECADHWNMNLWMNKCHTNFTSFYKSMC